MKKYTIDLKNRKVIFHLDQPMDFEDIIAEYAKAKDEEPVAVTGKRAMEIIKAIADNYADIVDFSGDDTYLEMAVCEYIRGGDDYDEEDDDEDED